MFITEWCGDAAVWFVHDDHVRGDVVDPVVRMANHRQVHFIFIEAVVINLFGQILVLKGRINK